MPPAIVSSLARWWVSSRLRWVNEADIDDVTNYRDPPSPQTDGKATATLGGYTKHEPDMTTFRNSMSNAGVR